MKKIIGLVVILFFLCYFCFSIEYQNYKIVGATLQKVDFKQPTSYDSYLLTFDVQYCNGKLKFLGNPFPSGLYGSIDSIRDIIVLNKQGRKISNQFKQNLFNYAEERSLEIEAQNHCDNKIVGVKQEKSFSNIVKGIRQNREDGWYFRIQVSRLLHKKATKDFPMTMKIVFNDRQINCKVDNNPKPVCYVGP